ncbi:dnaJ homolog subfamily B member 1 [Drosophila subobscura]|uniref:dnaJ homolog subfamily B member 1 n=1 Tax=Drosophila subobscura TaxID=7241 RepID=UPI00155AF1D1|nr:dnaJ homolog subfamily B member 1 [Drosophila subobscura]
MPFAFARCWAGMKANREAAWREHGDEDHEEMEENEESTMMLRQSCLDRVVADLCWANYDLALRRISDSLSGTTDRGQIGALLELKNIVIRVHVNADGGQSFGPTYQSAALPHAFTAEMLDVVQKVLRCSNHYEVLRLSQNDTYSEVKRSYKRLALRLHPDKNRAPGAEMAFRRISEAADCLTDHNRRLEYNQDMFMGDSTYDEWELQEEQQQQEEEGELGAAPRRPYMAANQRVPQSQALFQTQHLAVGMVCSLLFMFLVMHFLSTVPEYSFRRSSTHSVARFSHARNIAYYMSPESAAKYTEEQREQLEQQIESVYIEELKVNCQQETRLRDTLLLRVLQADMQNMRQRAEHMPMPACEALHKIGQSSFRPLLQSSQTKENKEATGG